MGLLAILSGCGGGAGSLEDYKGSEPQLNLQEYFNGPIKAWGFVQDYSGKVTRRFDVELVGSWEGDIMMGRPMSASGRSRRFQTINTKAAPAILSVQPMEKPAVTRCAGRM